MRAVNLVVMFLLELGVIAGVAVWGFSVSGGLVVRVVAGVLAPLLFILMWAMFGAAADARFPLTGAWRVALELIWFGGGALAWSAAVSPLAGVLFFAVWAVNAVMRVLIQGGLNVDPAPSVDE
ncbi:YrdB family protein [Nocardia brasiliensis]|uniref:YrdB family protein n=1 Tax=Nocardia brasiliensis TaxID=37326 RepID=UPI000AF01C5E|nr:YrdB family protein [Nocardia brasiliensis]